MIDFDPAPTVDDATEPRQQWLDDTDTFGRVYDVILGITTPTPAAEIAEIADCSPNAASKHLSRLAEMGVVDADRESRPARYRRNDGYLEWQEASRIVSELTTAEIIDRVESLEAEHADYEERFGTTDQPRSLFSSMTTTTRSTSAWRRSASGAGCAAIFAFTNSPASSRKTTATCCQHDTPGGAARRFDGVAGSPNASTAGTAVRGDAAGRRNEV